MIGLRFFLAIALLACGFGSSAGALSLPEPSGPYGIGTLTYSWLDTQRPEIFSADPSARRELMAQVWYPSRRFQDAPRASYIPDADVVLPALLRLQNLQDPGLFASLQAATTHAVESAAMATQEQRYPVLIFLEGLTGFRQMNTFQVEELVSHGYIVVALDQPYAAASVLFPGRREPVGLSREQLLEQFQPLLQQSLSPVKPAPVLNGRSFEGGLVPYLAQDVHFALEQLGAIDRADPQRVLTHHLDLRHAGVFGISLGGIVASEACRREPALRACLVMDAPMPADVVEVGLQQPSMWITRDAATMRQEGWAEADIAQHETTMRAVFESLPGAGYFLQVQGLFHANLTDIPLWSPTFASLGVAGPIDAERAHAVVNAYSVAFFERHLKGHASALLIEPSDAYPEVSFECRRR
jgi:pimeloyl-ACP methyl ester carboxylesterase